MNWKYTAASTGATALVGWLTLAPQHVANVPVSRTAVEPARAASDIEEQALRLRTRLSDDTLFHTPARDPFRFAAKRRAAASVSRVDAPVQRALVVPEAPPPSPFKLSGIASDLVDGETVRTAVLRTSRGVELVRKGDALDGGYQVTAIDDESIELQNSADGSTLRLRLGSN